MGFLTLKTAVISKGKVTEENNIRKVRDKSRFIGLTEFKKKKIPVYASITDATTLDIYVP